MVLGIAVSVVLRSLFLHDYRNMRMGSIALAAVHTALVMAMLGTPYKALLAVAAQLAVVAASGMPGLAVYPPMLASIPAAWMGITQALFDALTGAPLDPVRYMEIASRSFSASLAILFLLQTANLSEASHAIWALTRSCTAAAAPLLVYRSIASMLSEAHDTIAVHRLKGVPTWRSLSILLLRGGEVSRLLEEGIWGRLGTCRPRPVYSLQGLSLQLVVISADAAIYIAL